MNCNARPTRLAVRELRADLLFRHGLERRDLIQSVDDLRALVSGWALSVFEHAVADNVALGRFTAGTGRGRLVIEEPV